jgi:hypothetical protein
MGVGTKKEMCGGRPPFRRVTKDRDDLEHPGQGDSDADYWIEFDSKQADVWVRSSCGNMDSCTMKVT